MFKNKKKALCKAKIIKLSVAIILRQGFGIFLCFRRPRLGYVLDNETAVVFKRNKERNLYESRLEGRKNDRGLMGRQHRGDDVGKGRSLLLLLVVLLDYFSIYVARIRILK